MPSKSKTIVRSPPIGKRGNFGARSLERDAFSADREGGNEEICGRRTKRDKAPELEENGE
jgi:hypothetical protein